jgi:hypothetical protein
LRIAVSSVALPLVDCVLLIASARCAALHGPRKIEARRPIA